MPVLSKNLMMELLWLCFMQGLDLFWCCFWSLILQSGEDNSDLAIYASRRDPTTGIWSDVEVAAKTPDVCDMNPSLFLSDNGTLFLDFHTGVGVGQIMH